MIGYSPFVFFPFNHDIYLIYNKYIANYFIIGSIITVNKLKVQMPHSTYHIHHLILFSSAKHDTHFRSLFIQTLFC